MSVAAMPPDSRSMPAGISYGLFAALLWGGWPVVSGHGVQHALGAADITALRFLIAGLVLLPLVWRRGLNGLGWRKSLVLAAGAGAPYVLLSVAGMSYAPAGHAGVIIPSCMLIFTTLGSWLLLGDRPTGARLAGLAVVIAGVALIGWRGFSGGESGIGDLMFVGGGLLWASYTVASRAWTVDPLHATAVVSVLSMILFLPAYVVFGDSNIAAAPASEVAIQAAYQGIATGILALLFYTRAVACLGAARGAVFATLVPGIAVMLAVPVLGEIPTAMELIGVVTVTVGMVYALGLHRPAPSGA